MAYTQHANKRHVRSRGAFCWLTILIRKNKDGTAACCCHLTSSVPALMSRATKKSPPTGFGVRGTRKGDVSRHVQHHLVLSSGLQSSKCVQFGVYDKSLYIVCIQHLHGLYSDLGCNYR